MLPSRILIRLHGNYQNTWHLWHSVFFFFLSRQRHQQKSENNTNKINSIYYQSLELTSFGMFPLSDWKEFQASQRGCSPWSLPASLLFAGKVVISKLNLNFSSLQIRRLKCYLHNLANFIILKYVTQCKYVARSSCWIVHHDCGRAWPRTLFSSSTPSFSLYSPPTVLYGSLKTRHIFAFFLSRCPEWLVLFPLFWLVFLQIKMNL